jgi:hypothetical protein
MAGAQPRTSCRSLFEQFEILPVPCEDVFSLMNFIVSNHENVQTNSSIHNINTKNMHHFQRPNANLSCFKKSTLYADKKIFNTLPCSLTILKNEKAKFKLALRKDLHTHPFYSVDEFFMCKDDLKYCFVK